MLQTQIINVLPRRLLATLWASQETRVSLSHFLKQDKDSSHDIKTDTAAYDDAARPVTTTASFLTSELPVRYAHQLRLLSTLTPDALQTPIIRHVAYRYLHDICTLLHPSLQNTSPRGFTETVKRIRSRQAASLVRLRYVLRSATPSTVALMDNISTISLGIQMLIDQHLSWSSNETQKVQTVCPVAVAKQAADDARSLCSHSLGQDAPVIRVERYERQVQQVELTYMPDVLYRILFESMVASLRARMSDKVFHTKKSWFSWLRREQEEPLVVNVFGGPTSVGFRMHCPSTLSARELNTLDIPRDPLLGIPTCANVLSATQPDRLDNHDESEDMVWHAWSGYRSAKTLASHWGGNLDAVSVDGIGSTLYLALDRDASLLERYPTRRSLGAAAYQLFRHHRRSSAAANASSNQFLTIAAAQDQLDAFLEAISVPDQNGRQYSPMRKDHSVSLQAAVAAAAGHV